jgi:hypothetical protein
MAKWCLHPHYTDAVLRTRNQSRTTRPSSDMPVVLINAGLAWGGS